MVRFRPAPGRKPPHPVLDFRFLVFAGILSEESTSVPLIFREFKDRLSNMTCSDCKRDIGVNEQSAIQDKTGRRLCVDCADEYWDVTICEPAGCSCSRGGNALTCETCRAEEDALASEIYDEVRAAVKAGR
jgi:hypothetical protein